MAVEYKVSNKTRGCTAAVAFATTVLLWWRFPSFAVVVASRAASLFLSWLQAYLPGPAAKAISLAPPLVVAVAAWFAAAKFPLKNIFQFFALYLHPQIDTEVVHPFPELRAWDPLWGPGYPEPVDRKAKPLLWVKPEKGSPRFPAYDALRSFAHSGASTGRHAPWQKPKELTSPLLWTVLTGRSGSGKTRMAVEFLRDELGQRTTLKKLGRWKRALAKFGQWFRHTAPSRARRVDDPWDVGWLRPTIPRDSVNEHRDRNDITALLGLLEKWHPIRPTALLLDDPKPGDSVRALECLIRRHKEFHYPVRLLIVNQSLPSDLDFTRSKDEKWGASKAFFHGPVIELDESYWLAATEIEAMFAEVCHRPLPWMNDPAEVSQRALSIYEKTDKGNPMLVEIALRWMFIGRPIEEMTPEALIDDRAERVEEAFRFLSREELWLIASSTLAGPLALPKKPIGFAFSRKLENSQDALARCYNLAFRLGAGGPTCLPIVRPERVGEAFVRRVVNKAPLNASKIVADAWRLNPDGVIRAIGRNAAYNDVLGNALRAEPPKKARVEALEHTLA
jgi:hypothetical protein